MYNILIYVIKYLFSEYVDLFSEYVKNFRNSDDHKQPIKKEQKICTSPKYTDGPEAIKKRYSTSLVIREIQNKTIVRYNHTLLFLNIFYFSFLATPLGM